MREVLGGPLPSHGGFEELPVVLGLLVELESQVLDGLVPAVYLVGHGLHLEAALPLVVGQLTQLLLHLSGMLKEERGDPLYQLVTCVLRVPSMSHGIPNGSHVPL